MSQPTAATVIDPRAATWISKHVLTRTYLKSTGGLKLVRLCQCQYGECGHCQQLTDHAECTFRKFDGNPPASPHTHIVSRSGAALTDVWTTGTPCRWICSCTTCDHRRPRAQTTNSLETGWSDPTRKPDLVVESHWVEPGQTVSFKLAAVEATNLGDRPDALFLTAQGRIISDRQPIALAGQTSTAVAYRRVSGGTMRPGDTVWLVPKTLGAPSICWKRPRAVVVNIAAPYATVTINGVEHRIHEDNIVFRPPAEAAARKPRAAKPQPAYDGYEETTLF